MLGFPAFIGNALAALRRHIVLILFLAAIVALAILARSWLDARDARIHLEATLAAQQHIITDATAREAARDAELHQTLAQITAAKQKVQTPPQAAAALAQSLPQLIASSTGAPLPAPITLDLGATTTQQSADAAASATSGKAGSTSSPGNTSRSNSGNVAGNHSGTSAGNQGKENQQGSGVTPGNPAATEPALRIPQEDLKPLFDTVQDCLACRAQLTAAQGDLADERTKLTALAAERDAAIRTGRGTFWSRARKAAKWFLIGAAAGAAAGAVAAHHHQ